MILQWVGIVAAIVVVDLALSGDNALVIGAVASRLKPPQRNVAIVFGGVMAIVLRILLAEVALFALEVPYLQAAGGLVILYIAIQLLAEHRTGGADDAEMEEHAQEVGAKQVGRFSKHSGLLWASATILFADVSMSLDNVLAVAALAHGSYLVLLIGILFSMVLLLIASSVIAKLIERFPVLIYLASAILAWTAGSMVLNDKGLEPYVSTTLGAQLPGVPLEWVVPPLFLVLLLLAWVVVRAVHGLRHRKPRPGDA